jgi:putative spermidine/putrescine transport system substrate-binding protein
MRNARIAHAVGLAFALVALFGIPAIADAPTAICYNCPPEWADWAGQLKDFQAKTGVAVPADNKNSGQSVAAMTAEKASPVADVVYYGPTFAIQAKQAGLTAPYKPANWDKIPAGLKDPDGYWFTIHSGTLGLFINTKALGNRPIPRSWADLTKPDYKGMVGYLDPTSAFVGYAGAVAVNRALGGTLDDFTPAIKYFQALRKNDARVPKQTSYALVLSGEIPILFDYDFNAYRAEFTDKAPVQFVIPREGTVVVPYVMSLVKGGPHPENGKKLLDFVLSDQGQRDWSNAFMRPVIASDTSAAAAAHFLPQSEYARATPIDFGKMTAAEKSFSQRYADEVP